MLANRYTRVRDMSRDEQFKIVFMASIFLKSVKYADTLAQAMKKIELLKGYSKYFWSEGYEIGFAPRMISMVEKVVKYLEATKGKLLIFGMDGMQNTLSEVSIDGNVLLTRL